MKAILLVEDDLTLLNELERALSSTYQIETADSVENALRLVSKRPFSAVISDYYLPDGSACDLARVSSRLTPRAHFIVMTAFADKDLAIECLNSGVSGFLEKPFTASALQAAVQRQLGEGPPLNHFLEEATRSFRSSSGSIALTEVEYSILCYLFMNEGVWIPRDRLVNALWPEQSQSRNVLDTHLSNLKSKIPGLKKCLQNRRGHGYRFESSHLKAEQ